MYAKIVNEQIEKYPYNLGELKKDNPNTSFPEGHPSDELLINYGIVPVLPSGSPQYDSMTQRIIQGDPVKNESGNWSQSWIVISLSDEEKAEKIAQLKTQISEMTQHRLDEFAKTRGYDDIKSACGYAGCSVLKFSQEGIYCRDIRAQTWATLYDILRNVEEGNRQMPTGFQDIESELPELIWPI